jgi:hypothetical protein
VSRTELQWFRLSFPRDGVTTAAVISVLSALSGAPSRTRLIFMLSATAAGIEHYAAVTENAADALAGELRAAIPSLRMDATEAPELARARRQRWQLAPAATALRCEPAEPIIASLLASAFPLQAGEELHLAWHLQPAIRPPYTGTEQPAARAQALRQKRALPGLDGYAELNVTASDGRRAHHLLSRTGSVLRSLNSPFGGLVGESVRWGQLMRLLGRRGRFYSVKELAAVITWPVGAPETPGLTLTASKRLLPDAKLPRTGRVLGVTDFAGIKREVAITPTASTRGLYLLGPTGSGKTSLIKNLVKDDLEQNRGVCVVETNGDLITDLLDIIPERRIDEVVLLDPTDTEYAVGFNPFAGSADASLIADQIGELFERLWKASWGPRTAQLTHLALMSLARHRGSTLLGLSRIYRDVRFQAEVIAGLDDPLGLEPDWSWFAGLAEREQAAITAPLLNKVRAFTARPSIRAIVGQSSPSITMRQIMEQRKILLVNLPTGLLGAETVKLLGCLVLVSLWQAATERARLPLSQRHPFSLVVDEMQDFAAAPVPWSEAFSQGRKYGLSLSVAHQNLDQIPRELREVIFANARSKAVFAPSASDAKAMERLFAPSLSAAELAALNAHTIAAVVALDDGSTARPVTLSTPPPPEGRGVAERVRQASRCNYARPSAEVEAELRRNLTATPPAGPVGSKRRGR